MYAATSEPSEALSHCACQWQCGRGEGAQLGATVLMQRRSAVDVFDGGVVQSLGKGNKGKSAGRTDDAARVNENGSLCDVHGPDGGPCVAAFNSREKAAGCGVQRNRGVEAENGDYTNTGKHDSPMRGLSRHTRISPAWQ